MNKGNLWLFKNRTDYMKNMTELISDKKKIYNKTRTSFTKTIAQIQ